MLPRWRILDLPLFLFIFLSLTAWGGDSYYVSPGGNDAWSGRLAAPNRAATDGPFKTLARAAAALQPGDACYLRAGVYRELLKPVRSGAPGKPITFAPYQGETPVLSGADPLTGWSLDHGAIYTAPMPWSLKDQNQLFASGDMLIEARWPNSSVRDALLHPVRARAQSGTPASLTDPNLPGGQDAWKGARLWCAGGSEWICWNTEVTGFDARSKTLTFADKYETFYKPRKGNPYVLMSVKAALDAEGEWWYDAQRARVHLWAPSGVNPQGLSVEAKRRLHVIDLSDRSFIHVIGLHFRAGGIQTNERSSDLLLKDLKGEYVGHSYVDDIGRKACVRIAGQRNEITGCEFAYSSGSILSLSGSDHKLINNSIHDGNYGVKWSGAVALTGRRQWIAYNTFQHSGRDLVTIHGLSESIIEHNDLACSGWLSSDLGLTYGHSADFGGTEIRYNLVHDNKAANATMGIYFDHLSNNVIVHHNVIWNVKNDPVRFNNPSFFDLAYNNTSFNTGRITTFDHSKREDLFGVRMINNIFNQPIKLPQHVTLSQNLVTSNPGFVAPDALNFQLAAGSPAVDAGARLAGVTDGFAGAAPDLGAYETGRPAWKAGHDFQNPPSPKWEKPEIAWMNAVRNASFELGTLEAWAPGELGRASISKGNGWGNSISGRGRQDGPEKTGTARFELKLESGARVEQVIEGLHPETTYTLSGWIKSSDGKAVGRIGVRDFGGPEAAASSGGAEWTRKLVQFKTGPRSTRATIFLEYDNRAAGAVFFDNIGLPREP